jgi:hypothetical protein
MARGINWDFINRKKAGAKSVRHNLFGDVVVKRRKQVPVEPRATINQKQDALIQEIESRTGMRFTGYTFDQANAFIQSQGLEFSRSIKPTRAPKTTETRKSLPEVPVLEVQMEAPLQLEAKPSKRGRGVTMTDKGKWRAQYKRHYLGIWDTEEEALEAVELFKELLNSEPTS